MASRSNQPLVVIVGPTASGKTSVSVKLANRIGGEIICADSRTIYKGMDIGTAKPSASDQAGVPHWGLDLALPGDRFTVVDFKKYALAKIEDIRNRGRTPIMVGGSGLYIDSVILDYQFETNKNSINRDELESMTLQELYEYCDKYNIKLPRNEKNKRYVVRAIEQGGVNTSRKHKLDENVIVVGITTDKNTLRNRIDSRIEQIFENGVVNEAKKLGKKYGWDGESMTGNVYRAIKDYLSGTLSIEQAEEKSKTLDWRLAKKQLTWLRRNDFIVWKNLDETEQYILDQLAKLNAS